MKRTISTILAALILAGGILIGMNIGGIDMATKVEAADLTVPATAKITSIVYANDRYYVRYADGTEYEFGSVEDMYWYASEVQTTDNAQRLLLAWWLARNPTASNTNLVVGKTLTFDLSTPSAIKVQ